MAHSRVLMEPLLRLLPAAQIGATRPDALPPEVGPEPLEVAAASTSIAGGEHQNNSAPPGRSRTGRRDRASAAQGVRWATSVTSRVSGVSL